MRYRDRRIFLYDRKNYKFFGRILVSHWHRRHRFILYIKMGTLELGYYI